ncbi:hypothetical protein [Nocardioides sp. GY 10127]|uniref:hypothetical protein n=1 Tax=Nocardioides sp. GY 10127 TaxID=2569762 RepID=UPI0010A8B73E|nr:hypothetical protein [Nocardioides sp. GY 10127]TIC82884.1 hypothetical protein E8D37_09510 [Nocardioides sp. GY 10127]
MHAPAPSRSALPRLALVPRLALALSLLIAGLGVLAAPATADEPSARATSAATTQYGYLKVTSIESYLQVAIASKEQVLYVDTAHADDDGFWYAISFGLSDRDNGLMWEYQPYGMYCSGSGQEVVYNGWLNRFTCQVKAGASSIFDAKTAACQESTGYPWKNGSIFSSDDGCYDWYLDLSYTLPKVEDSYGYECAPWEDQTLDRNGTAACLSQTYAWQDAQTSVSFWAPAPDACTGMPADTSSAGDFYDPEDYAPVTGGDGSCDGSDPTPNCTDGNTSYSCTGVMESTLPLSSVTVTRKATSTRSATRSATESATATRASVRVTVHGRSHGRRVSASAVVRIRKTRSAGASATASATKVARWTATTTCRRLTSEEADTCARASAVAEASATAQQKADTAAKKAAQRAAADQASAQAVREARARAAAAPVSSAERRAARQRARTVAERRLAAKIARLG